LKLLNKKKNIKKSLFKITITKKILSLYFLLLLFTVALTSLFSYIFFLKLIENRMIHLNVNIDKIKIRLEELYEKDKGKITFDLSELKDKNLEKSNSSFFGPISKDFPEYKFDVEAFEGKVEYEEKPRLVYEPNESKYYFEVSRQIKFKESAPIKSLKLSVKLEFYKIMLKSLIYGALITIVIILPFLILFSRTITKPILKISRGAKQIALGNLGIEVKSYAKDELGDLVGTFNNMSKELHKIKKIRDDLLAIISHELRSPLGRIKGYTELLNDLKLNKKERDTYYNSIFGEIDFVNYMIGEIIEISRLELNKEQLFLEKIDISLIIEEVKKVYEITNNINKGIDFEFVFEEKLYCEIDIEKIKRVLNNAIENSIKAKSKKIIVNALKKDDYILIKIIDNGMGIPDDQLDIVFEKFYRVDKSRDRETGGFGLGLAICRGIINEHKGSIYFVKKDIGAELHIEIPLLNDDDLLKQE
jgi:signal transduction histidine kinase